MKISKPGRSSTYEPDKHGPARLTLSEPVGRVEGCHVCAQSRSGKVSLSFLSLLALALLALSSLAAAAQDGARPPVDELKRNIERWKSLPPAERERIKQSYRQYKQFRPEQRTAVQENFQKFRNLTPERRRELSKKLEGLPPQQRERIAHQLRKLQQMGADRRKMAVAFARMAKSLTPEQKRQLEQAQTPEEKKKVLGAAFRGHVVRMYLDGKSAEERAEFQGLPPEEQKKQLQKFFKERVVRGPPGDRGGGK